MCVLICFILFCIALFDVFRLERWAGGEGVYLFSRLAERGVRREMGFSCVLCPCEKGGKYGYLGIFVVTILKFCKHELLVEVWKKWPQCLGFKESSFQARHRGRFAIIS